MLNSLLQFVRNYRNKKNQEIRKKAQELERKNYLQNGQIPWSEGYLGFRNDRIFEALKDKNNLNTFANKQIPANFGYRLDERIVEYSWIFSQLPQEKIKLLDAGSTFNYDFIINQEILQNKEISILTYAPESPNFNEKRVSYSYADLRDMPFKDNYFDFIVSQSTIEHIDMDNSIYGYDLKHNEEIEKKSYEYFKALKEVVRMLKNKGTFLLTFPYGKFEHHGFFQQFDAEMVGKMQELFTENGEYALNFFKYNSNAWQVATQEQCNDAESYNPHTGKGKGNDGVAHSRAICCIKFVKK